MDFQLTHEQKMLRDLAREFTDSEIRPNAMQIDENEEIPQSLIKKLAEVGLLGTAFPEQYGGGGFGEVGYCIAQEEVTKACASTATLIGAHQSIGTNAIYLGGSEELKMKYLPALTSGEKIAAFALTEPEAGSDSFNLKTEAKLVNDKWILNGAKSWISNGSVADIFSVFARTENGITGFVVERDFPGVHVGPNEKKMGLRGSSANSLTFENVEIPKENLIGRDGRGFITAMNTLDAGRLGLGAGCVGAAKELLKLSTNYAKQRKQFGNPISKFQAIQFMLADITTNIYAMESIVYRTAHKYDKQENISSDAAIVKLFCSEAIVKIADIALQVHGGMGFSREMPIERFYRDARIMKIFEGTNEIQRLIIAKNILKNNGKWAD